VLPAEAEESPEAAVPGDLGELFRSNQPESADTDKQKPLTLKPRPGGSSGEEESFEDEDSQDKQRQRRGRSPSPSRHRLRHRHGLGRHHHHWARDGEKPSGSTAVLAPRRPWWKLAVPGNDMSDIKKAQPGNDMSDIKKAQWIIKDEQMHCHRGISPVRMTSEIMPSVTNLQDSWERIEHGRATAVDFKLSCERCSRCFSKRCEQEEAKEEAQQDATLSVTSNL
jgi:hypothetical protein